MHEFIINLAKSTTFFISFALFGVIYTIVWLSIILRTKSKKIKIITTIIESIVFIVPIAIIIAISGFYSFFSKILMFICFAISVIILSISIEYLKEVIRLKRKHKLAIRTALKLIDPEREKEKRYWDRKRRKHTQEKSRTWYRIFPKLIILKSRIKKHKKHKHNLWN